MTRSGRRAGPRWIRTMMISETPTTTKKDVETVIQGVEVDIESATDEISSLEKENSEMQTAVKRAGEDRAAENRDYQQLVADQRAAQTILKRVHKILAKQYGAFIQQSKQPQTGVAEKHTVHGAGPGVLGMLDNIVADMIRTEEEAIHDEQRDQAQYEQLLRDSFDSIQRNKRAITSHKEIRSKLNDKLVQENSDLKSTDKELSALRSTAGQLQSSCGFFLKTFDTTQQKLADEIEAITKSKAILSGASFS
mmetsp:Transcript_70672/g.188441  ORF Transcript_70672/g.188441 Transcript_70672/m.188441 type:complete len:251 (+) Transcript_70672:1344-2096(+)